MVAQSSIACTSLTVSCARRSSASADRSAVASLLVFLPADRSGCRPVRHRVSHRRPPGCGPPPRMPPPPWPAGAWPAGRVSSSRTKTSPARTFWPALRLTSTTRASSFEPMLVSWTARIVPTADSERGNRHETHSSTRPPTSDAWDSGNPALAGTFGVNVPASQSIEQDHARGEAKQNCCATTPSRPSPKKSAASHPRSPFTLGGSRRFAASAPGRPRQRWRTVEALGRAMGAVARATAFFRPHHVQPANLTERLRARGVVGHGLRDGLVLDRDHDVPHRAGVPHGLLVQAADDGRRLRVRERLGVDVPLGLPDALGHVQGRLRLPAGRPPDGRHLVGSAAYRAGRGPACGRAKPGSTTTAQCLRSSRCGLLIVHHGAAHGGEQLVGLAQRLDRRARVRAARRRGDAGRHPSGRSMSNTWYLAIATSSPPWTACSVMVAFRGNVDKLGGSGLRPCVGRQAAHLGRHLTSSRRAP